MKLPCSICWALRSSSKILDTAIGTHPVNSRPNVRFVTLDGEVIDTSGAITGGQNKSEAGWTARFAHVKLETLKNEIGKLTQKFQSEGPKSARRTPQTIARLEKKIGRTLTQRLGKISGLKRRPLTKRMSNRANLQVTRLEQQLATVAVEKPRNCARQSLGRARKQQALETENRGH